MYRKIGLGKYFSTVGNVAIKIYLLQVLLLRLNYDIIIMVTLF